MNFCIDICNSKHRCSTFNGRHQINHFVSTLQQYVESQLSHVSWCRFLHSLEHKVWDKFF